MNQKIIVAEVSKTWVNGMSQMPETVSTLFEGICNLNYDRGYDLQCFDLSQVASESNGQLHLVETIIAVFKLRPAAEG